MLLLGMKYSLLLSYILRARPCLFACMLRLPVRGVNKASLQRRPLKQQSRKLQLNELSTREGHKFQEPRTRCEELVEQLECLHVHSLQEKVVLRLSHVRNGYYYVGQEHLGQFVRYRIGNSREWLQQIQEFLLLKTVLLYLSLAREDELAKYVCRPFFVCLKAHVLKAEFPCLGRLFLLGWLD